MIALAAAVGGLYALGAILVFHYLETPETGAAFFPPAGLTAATFALTPRRTWPLWAAAIALAEIGVDLANHQTIPMALGFAAANVLEPIVGVSLMILTLQRGRRPRTPHVDLARYLLCLVVAGPLVGGLVGGGVSWLAGTADATTPLKWWLGDAIGVLVVATPILAWARRSFYDTPASTVETFATAVVAALVIVAPAVTVHDSFRYVALAVLFVAALRGGPVGTSIAGAAVAFSASWVVASGRTDAFTAANGVHDALVDTQLFIGFTLTIALLLSVEVCERTRVERVLRHAEAKRVGAELAAMEASATERQRIARETHDIVGHALNVMILSGAAARRVVDRDVDKAKALLETIEDVGREAFDDLDIALGLADTAHEAMPPKGLPDLGDLVTRLQSAGMTIEYRTEGEPRPLPKLLEASAYRIVQEALTNAAKHASAEDVAVTVRYLPDVLHVEVANGGTFAPPTNGNHRGLVGMRERVAVLGGHLAVGPRQEGGYSVVAQLPT